MKERETKSGYIGVQQIREEQKWRVKFKHNCRAYCFGTYFSLTRAVQIADEKIKEIRGENATTNEVLIINGEILPPQDDLNKEIIENLPNYEGHYQVSSLGRVKSLTRKNNRGYILHGQILVPYIHTDRRLYIGLAKNTIRDKYLVHRLVGLAFIPNPNNLPEINHIDGNCQNNRVENLEWSTSLDNNRHGRKIGLFDSQLGSKNWKAKLKESDILEIRNKYIPYVYHSKMLAEEYGVARTQILRIVKGKDWKQLPFDAAIQARLTEKEKTEIKEKYLTCPNYSELGRNYDVDHSTISRIVNSKK